MKRILFLALALSATIIQAQTFYLDENGVTIKCLDCQPGDLGIVDGVVYTAVDNEMLNELAVDCEAHDFSVLCTTLATDLSFLFQTKQNFNDDISSWDVSNVEDMHSMFRSAINFNQDIGAWDVSNVENMRYMFSGARYFNQDIGGWDVSNVEDMTAMFAGGTGNTMFFNQDIGAWDVSSVVDMNHMFYSAYYFNQDIGAWDVSSVEDMSYMFATYPSDNAILFNQDIGAWDVSSVLDMHNMFDRAEHFNQDIGAWDVSNVEDMSQMFNRAYVFNQDIGAWNVSNVQTMWNMFNLVDDFNQDIGSWDVSNVNNMSGMLGGADSFDQDLTSWCVPTLSYTIQAFCSQLDPDKHPVWGTCPEGCTDFEACNYIPEAEAEDGSCLYPDENYLDCQGFCLNDIDQNGICDELEVAGCTDPIACNYDDTAIEDDGSCTYPTESFLDCEGNCLNDMDLNGICDELEILGCTDPTACNYEELATQDDGTCDYIDAILIVGDTTPFTLEESVYNCTNTPGSTYEWVVEGGVISSGQGTSAVTVLWAEIGNGLLTVTESTESQCQGTTTLQVQIECSTSTTAIDGPVGPGELLEVVYSCDGDAGSTFDWSISNGVITSGQGTSTVTVIWASTGLGSISVQETTAANCDGDEITLDVVVVVSTGINDITTERLVSVYPNPVSTSFTISVDEQFIGGSYSVYDFLGRSLMAGVIDSQLTEVDIMSFSTGNYTLVLHSTDGTITQLVILKK